MNGIENATRTARRRVARTLIGLATVAALTTPTLAQVVDFEDLPVGATTTCGDPALISRGVPVVAETFFYFGGGSTCNQVLVDFNNVNGTRDLLLGNVNARFLFPGPLESASVQYAWFGGNLNLRVNGQLRNVNDPNNLAGVIGLAALGQVQVQVNADRIILTSLTGAIFDFAIGGQEFFIDDVAYNLDGCFDSTPPQAEITDPTNGACICGDTEIIGTAADFDDGLLTYRLRYRALFDPNWTTFDTGNAPVVNGVLGVFSPGTLGLSQGIYLIELKVINDCGDDEEQLVAVYYDTGVDQLQLDSPGPGNVVGSVVCFDGTVNDNGCFDQYVVGYRPAGSSGAFQPVDPANPVYTGTKINEVFATWNTLALGIPDGDYEIRINASTDCGYSAQINLTLTVDNTTPTAEITYPVNCQAVDGVVTVTGTAYDENIAAWTLQFTGGPYNTWQTIASGNTNVIDDVLGTWDVTALPPCCYELRLVVTDLATLFCNSAVHHQAEFDVSLDVNPEPCPDPADVNGDGMVTPADIDPFVQCLINGGCP
jgi:hypothetical protein